MRKAIYSMAAIVAVSLALTSCSKSGRQTKKNWNRVPSVLTVKIPEDTATTFSDYTTSIEGIINSEARPKISGYITQVLVDEGQKVHKGQLMFKLETASLSEQADAAKANIDAAQVKVNQIKPLVKKNIISANELATAKAQLEQAKSTYKSILANIGYADVRSPVNGYVGEIRIRKGNLVSPNDPKPLTTVTDISQVYAYFSMNEADYLDFLLKAKGATKEQKIKNLPKVTLIMANGEVYPHKGTIQTINSQINKQTGSVSFRAIFPNPEHILTNGSTGEIRLPKLHKNVLLVPQNATYEQQGTTYVMAVVKTDSGVVAKAQAIHIIGTKRNLYLVKSGVSKGEEIVAAGVNKVHPGEPIKPVIKPFDSMSKPIPVIFK